MALIGNVILMLLMAGSLTIANYFFTENNREAFSYIYQDGPDSGVFALGSFFSFYLILNSFMPLELPIIMEFSKFLATMFMQSDAAMTSVNK